LRKGQLRTTHECYSASTTRERRSARVADGGSSPLAPVPGPSTLPPRLGRTSTTVVGGCPCPLSPLPEWRRAYAFSSDMEASHRSRLTGPSDQTGKPTRSHGPTVFFRSCTHAYAFSSHMEASHRSPFNKSPTSSPHRRRGTLSMAHNSYCVPSFAFSLLLQWTHDCKQLSRGGASSPSCWLELMRAGRVRALSLSPRGLLCAPCPEARDCRE